MEGSDEKQEPEVACVIKVAREPAIIISGVPDLPPDCTAGSQSEVKNDAKSQVDPHFGAWLEGRKVRKLFGDTYYLGKVAKYDSESNWYNIIYDDGDQEDLEWCELEAILLPLDITVPLKTLVLEKCKLQGSVPDLSRPRAGRPRKVYATMDDNTKMAIVAVESQGQQPNNVPGLLPASIPSDTSGQLVIYTGEGNTQPRKRGRPRIDRSLSADNNQPKKRGRPPKNSNASGNSQSVESTPSSQNSTLVRNTMTARAERLKRENLRVRGTSSGTQLL